MTGVAGQQEAGGGEIRHKGQNGKLHVGAAYPQCWIQPANWGLEPTGL